VIFGNGEGKALMVCPQMPPAVEWKIVSRPMNTTTIERTGALCSGLNITRSMTTPSTNENSTTAGRAIQNGTPTSSSCQHMKALNMASSPCAKLRWSVETKIITRASAKHA
jgi:hypothetical protein